MTAATLTLTSFLLARIAEDEAETEGWTRGGMMDNGRFNFDRVLAECESKRRIVGLVDSDELWDGDILRALAAVYSDHPDYDESWRP